MKYKLHTLSSTPKIKSIWKQVRVKCARRSGIKRWHWVVICWCSFRSASTWRQRGWRTPRRPPWHRQRTTSTVNSISQRYKFSHKKLKTQLSNIVCWYKFYCTSLLYKFYIDFIQSIKQKTGLKTFTIEPYFSPFRSKKGLGGHVCKGASLHQPLQLGVWLLQLVQQFVRFNFWPITYGTVGSFPSGFQFPFDPWDLMSCYNSDEVIMWPSDHVI